MKKNWLYQKTVIVSGASGGIGFHLSKILIEKYDCKIIGIARNEQKIKDAINTLGVKKENFSYRIFDVGLRENWQSFYDYLIAENIHVDVLVNNAGFMLPFAKFEKYSDAEIDEILRTNLNSNIYAIKILMPLLKKSSTPAIVNVASSAGLCAVIGESMYCATKFAMHGFTETLIQEYKKEMYIGGVYPGFIKTNILGRMSIKDKENKLITKIMMPVQKAAKKIAKGMAKRKKRMVMGFDGRYLSFCGRLFPKSTPAVVSKVLKLSGLELFDEVFPNKTKEKGESK